VTTAARPPATGPQAVEDRPRGAALPAHIVARVAELPWWATVLVGVLAWAAALAAIAPIVHGYLTNPPDQRLVDLDVYRTGGLSVLQGQPLYSTLTQPPQLLPFTYPPVAAG
jgi:alpha-1,2-mannosyltransferase